MSTSDSMRVLIHDLEEEDLPFVTLSKLECLRLDWPKTLFAFMSRYQFDLDQMCKDCRKRFGSMQSGNCTFCGKHIQQNWASTLPCIIWSSRSCGDVRSRGVPFGRERRRIVSII